MGYTALYRKFRPLTFSEMVGQEHITRTLRNQIISNRVGHAYLFNGGRGTGKTTSAKVLARAINCLNPKDGEPCNECEICKAALNGSLTDIVEMDAASNNSVEDIRSIREEVNFLPTKAKYRVYIIDEVHMLSSGAFNALLKTLEEPPEHVKFILATTEPQKLPATILSRCQRFDFKRISNEDIVKRLKVVCSESKIQATDQALMMIAVLSEGAMRDALSILERCVQDGDNEIQEDKIKDLVGIPKLDFVHGIIKAVLEYHVEDAINFTNDVLNQGKDLENFLWEMIRYVKDLLIYKSCGKLDLYNEKEIEQIKELLKNVQTQDLVKLVYDLSELQSQMKWSTQKTILFQAGIIKLCAPVADENSSLEDRVSKIENFLKSGNLAERVTRSDVSNINETNFKYAQNTSNVGRNAISNLNSNSMNSNSINSNNMATNNVTPNKENPVKLDTGIAKKTYSGEISQAWPKMIKDLKESGKMVLSTALKDTKAVQMNDLIIGIQFPRGINTFEKTVLDKQENIKEITNLVSMSCGKPMQIKYIDMSSGLNVSNSVEDDIKNLAKESDIPFEIIE